MPGGGAEGVGTLMRTASPPRIWYFCKSWCAKNCNLIEIAWRKRALFWHSLDYSALLSILFTFQKDVLCTLKYLIWLANTKNPTSKCSNIRWLFEHKVNMLTISCLDKANPFTSINIDLPHLPQESNKHKSQIPHLFCLSAWQHGKYCNTFINERRADFPQTIAETRRHSCLTFPCQGCRLHFVG